MATASEQLAKTDAAIEALTELLTTGTAQEYEMPDGRRVVRADFGRTLKQLMAQRAQFQREVANTSIRRTRLARPT